MANANKPFGFSPWKYIHGAPWNGQANMYYIPSTDTSEYSIGDPVKSAAGMDANGVPQVAIAAGTDTVRGVIVGVLPVAPSNSLVGSSLTLETLNVPATKAKDYYVMVADDPGIIYRAQMDNGTVAAGGTVASSANKNCTFTASNSTGTFSNAVLGAATVATTNTLNVKLMGLSSEQGVNNGVTTSGTTGQYSVWLCMFNEHELQGATAGV